MPDDAPWADPVAVPDDLRDLQSDIDAYHRELRLARRRRRWSWLTGSRVWQQFALPVAVSLGSLGLAGIVFAVLTIGHPGPTPGPVPVPIATAPIAADGQVGGLLPDVTVTTHGGTGSIRGIRPALVALVPMHCDCARLLTSLAGQAEEVSVPLVVVAPAAQDAEVAAFAGRLPRGRVDTAFDPAGRLAATYGATGVTVLVVAGDATVGYVGTNVAADVRLELQLQQVVRPVAIFSGR
jgi:hypothetical protein